MTQNKTKQLTMAGVCIALTQILNYIKVFEMPQGGSITAGSMVPLLLYAFLYGPRNGFIAGAVSGLLQLALGGKFIHPGSVLLDYILAFGVLGIAGCFKEKKYGIITGTIVACTARFLCSLLSGWLIFGSYAPEGQSPIVYSFIYNITYMLPETVISLILICLLYPPIKKSWKFS